MYINRRSTVFISNTSHNHSIDMSTKFELFLCLQQILNLKQFIWYWPSTLLSPPISLKTHISCDLFDNTLIIINKLNALSKKQCRKEKLQWLTKQNTEEMHVSRKIEGGNRILHRYQTKIADKQNLP